MNSNSLAGINHDSFEQAQLINYTSLSQLSAEIKLWLEARQTSRSIIYFITLTFEEMALRCIRFGYSDSTEHLLQVKVLITPTDVTLRLIDDASPYNPAFERESLEGPPSGRPQVEGIGMMLVRTLAHEIFYARHNTKNVSTFRKKLHR